MNIFEIWEQVVRHPSDVPTSLVSRANLLVQALPNEDFDNVSLAASLEEVFLGAIDTDLQEEIQDNMRASLARWDRFSSDSPHGTWTRNTVECERERRNLVYELLGIPSESWEKWDTFYPKAQASDGKFWQPVQSRVRSLLGSDAAEYEAEVDAIVKKIRYAFNDTQRKDASIGMITGHVQSGKTMNMVSVIAKIIHKDFDLVVILGGTNDILRVQTQQRFDRDLVGSSAVNDYEGHTGFPTEFVDQRENRIFQFSTKDSDVKEYGQIIGAAAKRSLQALRNEPGLIVTLKNPDRIDFLTGQNFDPNIRILMIDDECDSASVGSIVKPNITEEAILGFLEKYKNTFYIGYSATPYANLFQRERENSSVLAGRPSLYPKDFVHVLKKPNGYAGYSEYFNVLSDAAFKIDQTSGNIEDIDEDEDMPVDLDLDDESLGLDGSVETHGLDNEKIHLRFSQPEGATGVLREVFAFWLVSGAVKLYRNDIAGSAKYKFHTVLFNESPVREQMAERRGEVLEAWREFLGEDESFRINLTNSLKNLPGASLESIKAAFEDLQLNRNQDEAFPDSLHTISDHIDRCLLAASVPVWAKLEGGAGADEREQRDVVLVVNGLADACSTWEWKNRDHVLPIIGDRSDLASANLRRLGNTDFQFCKMLIGGNMLSRGFTVEGLSTVVFGRNSTTVATLLQMCRWFGFPAGAKDLTRILLESDDSADGNGDADSQIAMRFRLFARADARVRTFLTQEESNWITAAPEQVLLEIQDILQHLDDNRTALDTKVGRQPDVRGGTKFRLVRTSLKKEDIEARFLVTQELLRKGSFEGAKSSVFWTKKGQVVPQDTSWLLRQSSYDEIKSYVEKFVPASKLNVGASKLLGILDSMEPGSFTCKVIAITLTEEKAQGLEPILVGENEEQKLFRSVFTKPRHPGGPYLRALGGATSSDLKDLSIAEDTLHAKSGFGSDAKLLLLVLSVQSVGRHKNVVVPNLYISKGFGNLT